MEKNEGSIADAMNKAIENPHCTNCTDAEISKRD